MRFNPLFGSRQLVAQSTLGHMYPIKEVLKLKSDVNTLKRKLGYNLNKFNFINKRYKFVDPNDNDELIKKLPLMSPLDRMNWKRARNEISRTKRELEPTENEYKWKNLSRTLELPTPNENDILALSRKLNVLPSEGADKFLNANPERFYPLYVFELAKQSMIHHKKFVNADEPIFADASFEKKIYWLDKTTESEDVKWGKGKQPLMKEVLRKRLEFQVYINAVKKNEKQYVLDVVNDHLGRPTKLFTSATIKVITTSTEVGDEGNEFGAVYDPYESSFYFRPGYVDPEKSFIENVCRDEFAKHDAIHGYNEEMGGFFSKMFKVVMSPFDVLVLSPFMKVMDKTVSPLMKAVLPSHLYGMLSGLTQASATILSGKVSKENIRKAVKCAIKVLAYASNIITGPVSKMTDLLISKISLVRSLDKYTGGLITSANELTKIDEDISKGKKIDIKARTFDAIKVGLTAMSAVATMGASIAVMIAANAVMAKTNLGKSSIGRLAVTAVSAYASGGASGVSQGVGSVLKSTIQKEAQRRIETHILKEAVRKGILKQEMVGPLMTTIQVASASSGDKGANFQSVATEVAKAHAKNIAVSQVNKQVGAKVGTMLVANTAMISGGLTSGKTMQQIAVMVAKDNAKEIASAQISKQLGNSVVTNIVAGSALDTVFSSSQTPMLESFGTNLTEATKSEAVRRADAKLGKLGLSVEKVGHLSKGDTDKALNDFKNFSQEDLNEFLAKEEDKLKIKIEEERLKAEQRVAYEREKIRKEVQKAQDFNSQEELDKIKVAADARIEAEQKRLGNEIERIRGDYNKGIDKIGNQIETFDAKKFIVDSKTRLLNKSLAERDRFLANWQDRVYGLKDKYGKDLLMYLMMKYGKQPDYDKFISDDDRIAYKTYVPPKNGRLYNRSYNIPLKAIGIGVAGLIAYYTIA